MFRFKAWAVLSSISNWLTNRRIVLIAAAIAFLGFTGPGLFGLSPPQFFHGHDAVTQQAKTGELPPGNHSASNMSPQVAQPDASSEIAAIPETSRDVVNTADATDGLMRDGPDQEPDQVSDKSLLAKVAKTLKGPNISHFELGSTKRVPASEPLLVPRVEPKGARMLSLIHI